MFSSVIAHWFISASARHSTHSFLQSFTRNNSGGLAIPIGIMITMLTSAVGMSVDYSRSVKAQNNLQDAVDASALAAAGSLSLDRAETIAHSVFNGSYVQNNNISGLSQNLTFVDDIYTYSVEAEVPTLMLQLIGIDDITVAASASAARGLESAEVVIALDTTGSMGFGSSWPQATAAMSEILVDLDTLAGNDDEFHATFLPFSDRVNVGRTRAEGWLSVATPPDDEWGRFTNGSGDIVQTGKGCLEPREELLDGNPHALTDASPTTLGFVPSAEGYYQSYLPERGGYTCPVQEVIGPTRDIASFSAAINNVGLSGTGRIDLGMAWAHRLLSPVWRGFWDEPGYPSDRGDNQKVAILITDMHTNAFHYEVPYQINDTANMPNFGHNNGTQRGFDNFLDVCERMKADGIAVHTVYVNGNPHGIPFVESCASSAAHFHEVTDVSGLRASLRSIASGLVGVRLVN